MLVVFLGLVDYCKVTYMSRLALVLLGFIQSLTLCLGCSELDLEVYWHGNSKSKMEMNWDPIRIILFECA
jgi:hypothetical protein